jgi:HK97 family phage major capsid protein
MQKGMAQMSIQNLREQRNAKAKAMADLTDEKRKWNAAADKPVWDTLMSEWTELDEQIKRIEQVNALTGERLAVDAIADRADRSAKDTKSPASAMFAKWLRGGDNAISAEEWAAHRERIRNTLSTTTSSQGGYTQETEVAKQVLDALKLFGGMRAVAEVFQTEMGNPMNFPTSDGTAETGEIIGQNTTATSQDPTFGSVALTTYKFSSKIVAVPFELLQDSQVDVEGFVRNRLVTRLGRITNTKFTVGAGDGSSEPNGIITAAGTGVTAANTTSQVTAIIYNSLLDLVHSVDPAYRNLGNCKFMMADSSVKAIRKIVDGQSRPIFQPGYTLSLPTTGSPGNAPDSILGYPIQVNQDVAAMAANAKSIAFGDFSFYKIRDVMDVQMFRFTDSAYTKLGQVGFLAWLRSAGNFIDVGGAVKLFVNAAS